MVSWTSLWAPILISAVACFIASSLIHMVLPYHRSDYKKVPSEDAVMEALRKFSIPPGDYHMPRPDSAQAMKSPEFQEKFKKGPVVMMTVMAGEFSMGKKFAQWFVYLLVVSAFAGCVAGHALAPGAPSSTSFTSWAWSRSPVTASRSGRSRSGTSARGARRSSRTSTR